MKSELLTAAKKYIKAGISVIATDSNKRSIYPWKKYEQNLITVDEITAQLDHHKAEGIAIVCGYVSGGLEVIDVDLKYALSPKFFEILKSKIPTELFNKLLVIQTRSGGYHFYYRCEEIKGNQKLAMRLPTDEEKKDNPQTRHMTLIETRGQGGYVVAPPSEGYVTQQGKNINLINIDERELLLEACRSLNEVFEPETVLLNNRADTKGFGLSPMEDYNKRGDVIELLVRHGWTIVKDTGVKVVFKRPGKTDSQSSGDFNRELNWFSVFTTNSCFEPNKAYLPYAVYAMLECNGDYKAACKKLLDEGYGEKRQNFGAKLEREVFKRKQDGLDKDALVTYVIQSEKKTIEEATEIIESLEKQWGDKLLTFWDIDKNGVIKINRTKLMAFLSGVGGFYIYFYDPSSKLFKLVRLVDGFIEESSSQQVKEFIKVYINSLPGFFDGGITPDDLMEVILKGGGTYFADAFFEFFDTITPDFLRSTKYTNYFPFRNGVVCVEKEKVYLRTYGELNKTVWRSRIIDFNITIDQEYEAELCEYFRFIQCISGNDATKWRHCLTIIGYLLHTYKDPARPWAIILAEETDSDKDGGGTGKGIFVKALSYLLKTVKLDGKNFKIDKNFALQRVALDTQLISIEDCDKAMEFEKFNSQITEGSTIEKKNKDELFVDYKDSGKYVFSTNYMLSLKGNHGKRRCRVFEFTPFFTPSNTPMDYFKHLMFDDWDDDEWNRFYNLMFLCVSLYLEHGIAQPDQTDKLKRKTVKVAFGEEFLDYWEDMMSNGSVTWHVFNAEYNSFLRTNDWDKKDYSNKRFKKGLQDTADLMGVRLETKRNRQIANQHEFKISKI